MLKQTKEEMIADFEKAAEEWPWKGKDLKTISVRLQEGHAYLLEAFGFDTSLKLGLWFTLIMSRNLRMTEDFPEEMREHDDAPEQNAPGDEAVEPCAPGDEKQGDD